MPALGRVVEGYGILQPRVSVTHAERGRLALLAPLRRAHRRRPVHDRRLGRLPGSLRAKASSPARASTTSTRSSAVLEGRVPENACCRTICSKACTRAPRSSPTSRWSTTTRRACWRTRAASIAGCAATGRSCGGSSRCVPTRDGLDAQPPAAHLALEDLRQPAAQPRRARACWRCCSLGWTVLPGSPRVLDAAAALAGAARAARASRSRRDARPGSLRGTLGARRCRGAARGPRAPTWRASCLQVVFLANTTVADAARDRPDAGPAGRHPAAAARVGDAPRPARARGDRPRRARGFLVGDDAPARRSPPARSLVVVGARARRRSPVARRSSLLWAARAVRRRSVLSRPVRRTRHDARRRPIARSCEAWRATPGATSTTFVDRRAPRPAARQRAARARAARRASAPRRPTSAWACWPTWPRTTSASSTCDDAGRPHSRRR